MKYFIIAIICLFTTIGLITLNCIYINRVCNQLISKIEKAEKTEISNAGEIVSSIDEFWKKEENKIALSVRYSETDRVADYTAMLISAYESQDTAEYKKAIKLLKGAAEEISRLEKLSFSNIF